MIWFRTIGKCSPSTVHQCAKKKLYTSLALDNHPMRYLFSYLAPSLAPATE
jgi:hypothetical protein